MGRRLFWVALVGAIASWPLVWSLRHPLPPPLPVLGSVPAFELRDERGAPYGVEHLRGRVWAASFIFTRCATICPAATRKMARIQARTKELAPEFHLVTFTVDPSYDTPERLQAYARAYRANPLRWTFVGGPEDAVQRAVVSGLRTSMGREAGRDGKPGEILHGTHIVLVDAEARMRGIYDVEADDDVEHVVRDAALLVNRGR